MVMTSLTLSCIKYVWPFYNMMHERAKLASSIVSGGGLKKWKGNPV